MEGAVPEEITPTTTPTAAKHTQSRRFVGIAEPARTFFGHFYPLHRGNPEAFNFVIG